MKQYPSIPAEIRFDIPVLAFNKFDGSNIRAEWTKKQGFFKFGTRTRLLGTDEKPLGEAIELIKNKYEKDLHDIFVKDRCEKIVAEKWNEPRERVYGGSPLPPCTTPDLVRALMRDYAAFAWEKVSDHRGISAERSISKLSAWIWVLGDDETLAKVEAAPYPQYGAPKLRVICEAYGFPIPVSEDLSRMMRGERCSAKYECGCGV